MFELWTNMFRLLSVNLVALAESGDGGLYSLIDKSDKDKVKEVVEAYKYIVNLIKDHHTEDKTIAETNECHHVRSMACDINLLKALFLYGPKEIQEKVVKMIFSISQDKNFD
jgi:hypothetical protein